MTDTVNVFSPDLRNKVKRTVDFLPTAWVEFYDDITMDVIEKAQELKTAFEKPDQNISESMSKNYDVMISQICSWNFADTEGKVLPINADTLKKLPYRFIKWISDTESELLNSPAIEDKKKS